VIFIPTNGISLLEDGIMKNTLGSSLIANLGLTPEEQFILGCLRSEFGSEKNGGFPNGFDATINWKVVHEKSLQWNVAPLMYKIIKNSPSLLQQASMPDHFVHELKNSYLLTFIVNETSFGGLSDVLAAFADAGIKVILLKGSHLALFVYQDIGVRPMTDIDILVKEEDLDKAEELLFRIGYYYYTRSDDPQRHAEIVSWDKMNSQELATLTNPKGIRNLDIHRAIEIPNSPFSINMAGLWKRAETANMGSVDILIFSPEDLLLHLSLHASYHHELRGLKSLCDIAVSINHYEDRIDWDRLLMLANEWKATKYLYLTLRLSKEIIGARVPDSILLALKPILLNKKIIVEAIKRFLFLETKPPKGMSYAANIMQFDADANLFNKLAFFLTRIFIPAEELAARYSLPASSKRVHLYHIVRLASLLYNYASAYSPYILYRLVHKREELSNYNLDLWLNSVGSKIPASPKGMRTGKR
jgi:hypothetical protein